MFCKKKSKKKAQLVAAVCCATMMATTLPWNAVYAEGSSQSNLDGDYDDEDAISAQERRELEARGQDVADSFHAHWRQQANEEASEAVRNRVGTNGFRMVLIIRPMAVRVNSSVRLMLWLDWAQTSTFTTQAERAGFPASDASIIAIIFASCDKRCEYRNCIWISVEFAAIRVVIHINNITYVKTNVYKN